MKPRQGIRHTAIQLKKRGSLRGAGKGFGMLVRIALMLLLLLVSSLVQAFSAVPLFGF